MPDYVRLRAKGEVELAINNGPYSLSKVKKPPWWIRYDPVLLILIVLFVAFEVVAHFHYHNANGWYTLSNRIVKFQQKYGWPARIVIYAGLIALAVHLWGGIY